VKTLNKFIQ